MANCLCHLQAAIRGIVCPIHGSIHGEIPRELEEVQVHSVSGLVSEAPRQQGPTILEAETGRVAGGHNTQALPVDASKAVLTLASQEGEDGVITYQVSASELNAMANCRRYHHYSYDLGFRPIDRGEGMDRGDIVHEGLKAYYRMRVEQYKEDKDKRDFSKCLAAADAAMTKAMSRVEISAQEMTFVRDSVFKYIDYRKVEGWIIIAAEQWFNKFLFQVGNLRFLLYGKIDLIVKSNETRELVVVDHKSGARVWEPSEMDLQYKTYAYGTGIMNVLWNFVGLQKSYAPKDRFVRQAWSYTPAQMEEFKAEIIHLILEHQSNTATGYFPHNPQACTGRFRKCDFYDVCKGDPQVRMRRLKAFFLQRGNDKTLEQLKKDYAEYEGSAARS